MRGTDSEVRVVIVVHKNIFLSNKTENLWRLTAQQYQSMDVERVGKDTWRQSNWTVAVQLPCVRFIFRQHHNFMCRDMTDIPYQQSEIISELLTYL